MIPYYQIRSPLGNHGPDSYIRSLENTLGEDLHQVTLAEYTSSDFALLYVASGGSEGYFLEVFDRLKDRPFIILTSGESNSLAASMEILAYLKKHGGRGEILHGDPEQVARRIRTLDHAYHAWHWLQGKNIGCIGSPSDWLIARDFSPEAIKSHLGLNYIPIPMEELLGEIKKARYEENACTERMLRQPFDKNETEKALHVYGALSRLADRYALAGVTVRCFDLLDTVHTTGCLGLSILNDLGIYAACEGDMPALVSMMILGSVTGKPLFMANPSRFDTKNGIGVFAHCTAPTAMLKDFCLNTHFESGIGAAVQGTFEEGSCTLFKAAGDLSRYHVQEGTILENTFSEQLCRTQIRVALSDFNYFLTDPIQNHHIFCRGRHADEIRAFFSLTDQNV